MKTTDVRKAVYRFSQVPSDVAEAKTQAILRILAEAIQERAHIAAPAPAQQARYKAVYSESAVAMATSEHGA